MRRRARREGSRIVVFRFGDQVILARLIGIDGSTLSRLVHSDVWPKDRTVRKLATFLGTTTEGAMTWLFRMRKLRRLIEQHSPDLGLVPIRPLQVEQARSLLQAGHDSADGIGKRATGSRGQRRRPTPRR